MKILVILVCGDISVHRGWGLKDRKYDLWISYYGNSPGRYREDADLYQSMKGFKWPITHDLIVKNMDKIKEYDYILLPDDDITWTSDQIVEIAELMEKYKITLACPSIADRGTCYRSIHTQPDKVGRLLNFVEILTPCFSQKALQQVYWTFKESWSGWGIDSIWAWEFSDERLAVFDKISLHHVRPQFRGEIYPALKAANRSPQEEAARIAQLYPFPGCRTIEDL